MILKLIQTDPDLIYFCLRVIPGILIFPYGMQKLLGWFADMGGGVGIRGTLANLGSKGIPAGIAWLIIIGESLGSLALILGCFGRIAAAGNFIIFIGALTLHLDNGWALNWKGKKKGEGVEYLATLLSLLLIVMIKGSGPISIDAWLLTLLK
jgi:putative oxidoreductase